MYLRSWAVPGWALPDHKSELSALKPALYGHLVPVITLRVLPGIINANAAISINHFSAPQKRWSKPKVFHNLTLLLTLWPVSLTEVRFASLFALKSKVFSSIIHWFYTWKLEHARVAFYFNGKLPLECNFSVLRESHRLQHQRLNNEAIAVKWCATLVTMETKVTEEETPVGEGRESKEVFQLKPWGFETWDLMFRESNQKCSVKMSMHYLCLLQSYLGSTGVYSAEISCHYNGSTLRLSTHKSELKETSKNNV